MPEATAPEPQSKRIVFKELRDWGALVTSIIAVTVSTCAFLNSNSAQESAAETNKRSIRLEANQYLYEAWDLLGGQAVAVVDFTNDERTLLEAHRLIQQALVIDPNNPRAHRRSGQYLHAIGDFRPAIIELTMAVELEKSSEPTDSRALSATLVSLGNALLDQSRAEGKDYKILDKAIRIYEEALQLEVSLHSAKIYNNLGNAWSEHGEFDKAEEAYRKAIALSPDLRSAYRNLGILYRRLSKHKEAEQIFSRLKALEPPEL
jgi:tetratricopeptide (TPR) repeat protein